MKGRPILNVILFKTYSAKQTKVTLRKDMKIKKCPCCSSQNDSTVENEAIVEIARRKQRKIKKKLDVKMKECERKTKVPSLE